MRFFIKEAREAANLTQAQLASALGVNATTLSGYETGKHDPKSDTLMQIANICGTTIDYLLGREVNESKGPSAEALVLAQKFDSLDEWGKRAVEALVAVESERCVQMPLTTASLLERAAEAEELTEKSV